MKTDTLHAADRERTFFGWFGFIGIWVTYLLLGRPFDLSGIDTNKLNWFEQFFMATFSAKAEILVPLFLSAIFIAWLSSRSILPVVLSLVFSLGVLIATGFGTISMLALTLTVIACLSYLAGFNLRRVFLDL